MIFAGFYNFFLSILPVWCSLTPFTLHCKTQKLPQCEQKVFGGYKARSYKTPGFSIIGVRAIFTHS